MSEDSIYQDADIVWVKLGSNWWPGEVYGHQRQPEGLFDQAKRKPYCVVKFFDEDSFEYVKSSKHIVPFNCNRKDEFVRKGHELFKAKKKFMEKFPSDVAMAERLTRSLTRSTLFFNSRPDSIVKVIIGESPPQIERIQNGKRRDNVTKIINITPNRNSVPSPATNSPLTYKCGMCDFKSTRQNVMVLHRKSHSGNAATPSRNTVTNNPLTTSPIEETAECTHSLSTESPALQSKSNNCEVTSPKINKGEEITELHLNSGKPPDVTSSPEILENDISDIPTIARSCDLLPEMEHSEVKSTKHVKPPTTSIFRDNYIESKCENIQKSLLADWIDEEKDDEEEALDIERCDSSKVLEKVVDNHRLNDVTNRTLTPVSEASIAAAATLPSLIAHSEAPITAMATNSQKISSKIRNIPKKDRRNIVFTNESTDSVEISKNDIKCGEQFEIETVSSAVQDNIPDTKKPASQEKVDDVPASKSTIQEDNEISTTKDVVIQPSHLITSPERNQSLSVSSIEISTTEKTSSPANVSHSKEISTINQENVEEAAQISEVKTQQMTIVSDQVSIVEESTIAVKMIVNAPETSAFERSTTESSKTVESVEDSANTWEHMVSGSPITDPIETMCPEVIESCSYTAEKQLSDNQTSTVDSNNDTERHVNPSKIQEQTVAEEVTSSIQDNVDSVGSEDSFSQIRCDKDNIYENSLNEPNEKPVPLEVPADIETLVSNAELADSPLQTVSEEVETVTSLKTNSANKSSLSCFDFQEEEDTDILTSIAKFKKKYISPEKPNETINDPEADPKKTDLEIKDKQLADEIESLLKSTSLPAEIAKTSFINEKAISNEVRGLPIKERGKRIFKSRNRFRTESCSSTSISLTEKPITEDSSPKNKNIEKDETPSPHKSVNNKNSHETNKNRKSSIYRTQEDSIDESSSQQRSVSVNDIKTDFNSTNKQKTDSEVAISGEEIIGRISFPPAEVFAHEAENFQTESNLISSTNTEVNIEFPADIQGKELITKSCLSNTDDQSLVQNSNDHSEDGNDQTKETRPSEPEKHRATSPSSENVGNQDILYLEEMQQSDQVNSYIVVEENEPIYEVEVYDEVGMKTDDPNCVMANEYDLITTEVTSVVSQIVTSNEIGQSTAEITENIASAQSFTVPTNIESNGNVDQPTDVQNPAQNLTHLNSVENVTSTIKDANEHSTKTQIKTTKPTITNHFEEISSRPMLESQSKNDNSESVRPTEVAEDENNQAEVDPVETSGDETSTIISEAEAEFGSPTSMLEEDRVLNMERSESETPLSNIEFSNNQSKSKSLKDKLSQMDACEERVEGQHFKLDKHLESSLNVHENKLDDIVHSSLKETSNEEKLQKPIIGTVENVATESSCFDISMHSKERNDKDAEKENFQETAELSTIEEDEEISSPSIEPLQDDSKDNDTDNKIVTTTVLSSTADGQTLQSKNKNAMSILNQDMQQENDNATEIKDLNLSQPASIRRTNFDHFENKTLNQRIESDMNKSTKTSKHAEQNTFFTILKNTDTIITLNESKEVSEEAKCNTISLDNKKSELAGEELSAAEALLLIPNQPSSLLDSSHELPLLIPSTSVPSSSTKPLTPEEMTNSSAKEEKIEHKEAVGQEIIRKKRRSHLKITPRKRVTETKEPEQIETRYHREAKIPKIVEQNIKPIVPNKAVKQATHKKTFAEQYEENFVLKYAKDQSAGEVKKAETTKSPVQVEKQIPEKVHITVDVSNPLSSQIASILGTHRPSALETNRIGSKKRKQTLEDDIPSFIIKRPSPKNSAEAEAADRDTIAQIQNLCPHVEITRKLSRDEQNVLASSTAQSGKPQILNQQILRSGNNNHNQPIITVTAKSKRPEDGMFDISSMPIVLSNDSVLNDKFHLVITPTSNPEFIRQFQNQQQLIIGSTNAPEPQISITNHGVQFRGPSNIKIPRTNNKQQAQEHQNQEKLNLPTPMQGVEITLHPNPDLINHDNRQSLQQQYFQQHKQLQQQAQQQQEQHKQCYQKQNQQRQYPQTQPQQQYQQQFQLHHQNQVQQKIQDDQRIFLQQHQQELLLQQQLHIQQQQQQQNEIHIQQQASIVSDKVCQTNSSDKQMGVDARGNKYVIIKAPPNTVLQRVQQQQFEANNVNCQRKLRQPNNKTNTNRSHTPPSQPLITNTSPALSHMSMMPIQSPHENNSSPVIQNTTIHTNDKPKAASKAAALPTTTITKPKTHSRGRRSTKQTVKVEEELLAVNESKSKNNSASKRSNQNVSEPPTRQRLTRSSTANKQKNSTDILSKTQPTNAREESSTIPSSSYATQQEAHSILYMNNPNPSSPVICTTTVTPQVQSLSCNQDFISNNRLEAPEGIGGGYAVPSLPVAGYPQTYLLCELINKKYREVSTKPMYLTRDRTKFLEIPDELLTDAHRKLTDSQREPNPDVLQVISGGASNILQPRIIQTDTNSVVDQMQHDQGQISFNKNARLSEPSVSEEASAILDLPEQIVQEQLVSADQFVHEQFSQEHLTPDQIAQEQLVQEHLVQEQLVQEQLVQEQLVQEQFVQEQLEQEQLVQDDLVYGEYAHGYFVEGQFIQNLTGLDFDGQLSNAAVLNYDGQQLILDEPLFSVLLTELNIEKQVTGVNKFTMPGHTYNLLLSQLDTINNLATGGHFGTPICSQQEIGIDESMLQDPNADEHALTVDLNDPGLYSDEQFINSGGILQIHTPEGLRLIGAAEGNTSIIFQSIMAPIDTKTNETNVLLNQAPKMSAIEMPSDKSKTKFDTGPATSATIEDCLNVIGVPVQSASMATSLEFPISVANSSIVTKDRPHTPGAIAMNEIIATGLCHHPDITSLPPMDSSDQELQYEFFQPSAADTHDKANADEESVVADMGGEYIVASNCGNFDEPGR